MFDECIEISDAEEIDTPPSSEGTSSNVFKPPTIIPSGVLINSKNMSSQDSDSMTAPSNFQRSQGNKDHFRGHTVRRINDDDDDGSEEDDFDDDDDDEEEEDDIIIPKFKGAYKPEDYDNLQVSPSVKELFQYIMRYTPQTIEPEYKLQHFVPSFIPAIGDVDAFISVPKPSIKLDGSEEKDIKLGLTVLNEPCAAQSDPALLALKLRAIAKQPTAGSTVASVVKKIDFAENNIKVIDSWIKDIGDLHRNKALPSVHYKRPMPTTDNLMQEWPVEFEDELNKLEIPPADLNCGLEQYVDIICTILDIPVYESKIESLHALFVLYASIRDSQRSNNLVGSYLPESEEGI